MRVDERLIIAQLGRGTASISVNSDVASIRQLFARNRVTERYRDITSVSSSYVGRRRILFSFFGVFMDERPDLAEEFRQRWPDVDLAQINQPFRGLAVRFQRLGLDTRRGRNASHVKL